MNVTIVYRAFEDAPVAMEVQIEQYGPQDGFSDDQIITLAERIFFATNVREGADWVAIQASGELERTQDRREHTSMCSRDSVGVKDGHVIATCLSMGWMVSRLYGTQWGSKEIFVPTW